MNDEKMKTNTPWWQPSLLLFMRISGWIAFPVIASLIVGKKLDAKFGTEPWIFIGLTVIAFIVSITAIVKICLSYMKSIEPIAKENDTHLNQK